MKITVTKQEEVEISFDQSRRIAVDFLMSYFDWKASYFIKDEVVYEKIVIHTSHSSIIDQKIRPATEQDQLICALLIKLK